MTKRKRLHNLILVLITVLAVFALMQFKGRDNMPILIIGISCLLYLVWALIYHKLDKSLTLAVTLEYVLTATLVLILLSGFLV